MLTGGEGAQLIIEAAKATEFNAKDFETMSASGPDTPKSLKRLRDEQENVYNESKRKIPDRIPQALVVRCIDPLRTSQRHPSNEAQILCNDIRNSEGYGDQIFATLSNEIVKSQSVTVEAKKEGSHEVLEGNRPNDLGVNYIPA